MHCDPQEELGTLDTTGAPRLKVTTRLPAEHIDGAWWPRTTQMTAELPTLLAALSDRLENVVAVGYPRDGWKDVPPHVYIDDRPVQLLGFTNDDPASVIVIGQDGHHLTLQVIAPDTSLQAARAALAQIPERGDGGSAGAVRTPVPGSVADVGERLAAHEGRHDDQRAAEIMRWCVEAARQFEAAPIQSFVPILVEHIVHNRMVEACAAKPTQCDGPSGALTKGDRLARGSTLDASAADTFSREGVGEPTT